MSGDKLFKEILNLQKNESKPDLHSFMANIKGGKVYVEASAGEIYIREYGNNEETKEWRGTAIAATNRLEMLGIDIEGGKIGVRGIRCGIG